MMSVVCEDCVRATSGNCGKHSPPTFTTTVVTEPASDEPKTYRDGLMEDAQDEISDARALLRVAAGAFVQSGDIDDGKDAALCAAARALTEAEQRWTRRAEEMARKEENR